MTSPDHVLDTVYATNCNDSGPGSLRDAVATAASGDTVDLTQLSCSRITLTTGSIDVAQQDLFIVGRDPNALAIDGSGIPGSGVILHSNTGLLALIGLTIENGSAYHVMASAFGGCVDSLGDLEIVDAAVQDCTAQAYFPYSALGGAIYSYGQVALAESRVTESEAVATGSYATGGGIYARGGIESLFSQVSGNAAYGGNSWGGGVFSRGPAYIYGNEISRNYAVNWSGLALDDQNGTIAKVVNSTVSYNRAGHKVGGVFAHQPVQMYNSTVAFNTSYVWSDNGHYFAAGLDADDSTSIVTDSILANNTIPGAGLAGDLMDLCGDAASVGGALDIAMGYCIAGPAYFYSVDPGLQPLQDHGGPTHTMVPTNADAVQEFNPLNLQWDQRGPGFPRDAGGTVILGAYEPNPEVIFANGFN